MWPVKSTCVVPVSGLTTVRSLSSRVTTIACAGRCAISADATMINPAAIARNMASLPYLPLLGAIIRGTLSTGCPLLPGHPFVLARRAASLERQVQTHYRARGSGRHCDLRAELRSPMTYVPQAASGRRARKRLGVVADAVV